MPVIHLHDNPDRFVAGTVGEPGHRVFFLQARSGARLTSVALEKEQVSVLADRLDDLLDELLRLSGGDPRVPAMPPAELEDNAPLDPPIEEEFRVGTMTLAWDGDTEQVVLEIFPIDDAADESTEEDETSVGSGPESEESAEELLAEVPTEPSEVFEVRLTAAAARTFAQRAQRVVAAGRPSCPFCGRALDPEGHICPRANGFHRLPA